MNSNKEFKSKYLKYKAKYLNMINSNNVLKGGILNYVYDSKFGSYGSGNEQFSLPWKIITLTNGTIAVCDSNNHCIKIFDILGNFIRKFGSHGNTDNHFDNPLGMTQLADGNIAICDTNNNYIKIFDISGNFIRKFNFENTGNEQITNPTVITQLTDGNIIIGDMVGHIQVFDTFGNFIHTFNYPNINYACQEIIQLENGIIVVCVADEIFIFDVSGDFIRNFFINNTSSEIINQPSGMTKLADGNIAIGDNVNKNIKIFNISGNFIKKFGSAGTGDGQFRFINSITQLINGNLAICDIMNNNIQIFRLEDQDVDSVGSPNINNISTISQYNTPIANTPIANTPIANTPIANISNISYQQQQQNNDDDDDDDDDDDIFSNSTPEPDINNISNIPYQQQNDDGDLPASIPFGTPYINNNPIVRNLFGDDEEPEIINDDYELRNSIELNSSNPRNIICLENNLYAMTDTLHKCIKIFQITTSVDLIEITDNFGNNNLNDPYDIIQLTDKRFLVSDVDENASKFDVKIFDVSGNYIDNFYSEDYINNIIPLPFLLQFKNGNIAISNNKEIKIFDISGNFIHNFRSVNDNDNDNEPGSKFGFKQLSNNNIAICNRINRHVQIFDISGNYIDKIDWTDLNQIKYTDNLFDFENKNRDNFKPFNLIQLNNGNILVMTHDNYILIFDIDYNYIGEIDIMPKYLPENIVQLPNDVLLITKINKTTDQYTIDFYSKINKSEHEPELQSINIEYYPYRQQPTININYWKLCDEKKFTFNINTEKTIVDIQNNDHTEYKNIIQPYTQKINIFDTLLENKLKLLLPNTIPFFIFHNITIEGHRDDGIDVGGLTRTVFYELSKYLTNKNSPYFEQDTFTKLYTLKHYSGKDKYLHYLKLYFLGQLFGLAIKLNKIIGINLDPILLYQLTHTLCSNEITKAFIGKILCDLNSQLVNKNPYMCYNTILAQNKNICIYNEDGEQIELNDLEKETTYKIISSLKAHKENNKFFIKGFREQINIKTSKINRLPLKKLDELIAGISDINFKIFLSNINFIGFNSEQKEYLLNIIKNNICISGEQIYLETLILVMTGSNKIVSSGYPEHNKLRFELSNNLEMFKPIEIHSCFNQFIINVELFNRYMNNSNEKRYDNDYNYIFSLGYLKTLSQEFNLE